MDADLDKEDEETVFERYKEKILEYKRIAEEIPIKMEHVIKMGMYEMHRDELIDVLVKAAERLKDQLISHCINRYQNKCKA